MFRFEQVSKMVAGTPILDAISCRVGRGETLAMLGPSGSGKTTLLRVLAGFEAPDAGMVSFGDRLLSRPGSVLVPPQGRGVVMAFQDTALFPHLNVEENVAFGLTRLPRAERSERVAAELDRFGVARLARRTVTSLSGGEMQRVSLARALAVRPEVLLLDEPFSNVDRLVRLELIRCLRQVFAERRMAVILVTHDARDALELATSVALLRQGRVVATGELRRLAEEGDEWVRNFLSTGLRS